VPESVHLIADLELPEHEAVRLIASVLGVSLSAVRHGTPVTEADADRIAGLAQRRRAGEPLQYLEGTAPFGPIELVVDPRVLIPRPETELLWELVSDQLTGNETVVDMGTGSGALALALKHRHRGIRIIATDVSADALAVAAENAERLQLDVDFRLGSVFEALDDSLRGRIDVLVSNPPYVAQDDWKRLPADVRLHEPHDALVAEHHGLSVIREVLAHAPEWLAPDGRLFIEIGETQGDAVLEMTPPEFERSLEPDLAGRTRFLVARRFDPSHVSRAVAALRDGQVIGMPTDTVYGLAALAADPDAVASMFELKRRPLDKPLPVMVGSIGQARELGTLSSRAIALAEAHWPGALTLVVPMRLGVLPPSVGDHDAGTVGIRVPDHPVCRTILEAAGPLAVTSANRAGEAPAMSETDAEALFGSQVALYVPGTSQGGVPSTVVDATADELAVLRVGPISL